MAGIGPKNSAPEIIIRKALHSAGFRFRLHDKRYPGRPDIVLPKYRVIINVNGCFWHGHGCYLFKLPATRTDFWEEKIRQNRQRDDKNLIALMEAGWRVCKLWECSLKGSVHRKFLPVTISAISDWIRGESVYIEISGGTSSQDTPQYLIS